MTWTALWWLGGVALGQVGIAVDAVVLLQQGATTCAGALIEDGAAVATAYHCVAQGGRPRVTLRDGTTAIGRIRSVDPAMDLAVVDVPDLAGSASLELGTTPAQGAEIWALGHPMGSDLPSGFLAGTLRWAASDGRVSSVGPRSLQISAAVNPGNSGGPVIDAAGRLVGVVSRRLAGDGLGFATRVEHLTQLLDVPRRPSIVGGTLAVGAVVTSHGAVDGGVAVGGRIEVALRDRLVIDGLVALPVSARWNAARFGGHEFARAEGRGGLRQRIGRGPWSATVEATAGVVLLERLDADPDDPLRLQSSSSAVPVVGGTIGIRSVGLELGWYVPGQGSRAAVVLRVPGVLTVF